VNAVALSSGGSSIFWKGMRTLFLLFLLLGALPCCWIRL